jgi:hypothetical protein
MHTAVAHTISFVEGKPIEPAAVDMAVLGAYGATMLTVQAFERNLAVLVLALEAKPWKTKPFKSKEQFRASFEKLISRQIDAFQRASAKVLRNRLPQDFDAALLAEIETAIVWRNRLAHRYLIESVRPGHGNHFEPGAFIELWRLSTQFQAVTSKLHERLQARLAELPKSEAPEPVREVFVSLARTIVLGEDFRLPESEAS